MDPRKFINIHIHLNSDLSPAHNLNKRLNYELSIEREYENIRKNFKTNTFRNIKKAEKNELKILSGISVKEIWAFKKSNPVNNLSQWHYQKLLSLLEVIDEKSMGESYGIYTKENQLIAAAYFVLYKNRIILLVSSSNEEGKDKSAMFILIDNIIQKYAGKNYILDFEGGNVSGLARFFSGFGANPKSYYSYKENRLMWPFNKLISC